MKGIILAGGAGTRLYPITFSISKQLLPIYDKPMIYYPLSVLMLGGIRDILIISSEDHIDLYEKLLKDGSHLGLKIEYISQSSPKGLADAFILGEKFIGGDNVALILGDNVFYGSQFSNVLKKSIAEINTNGGAIVFGYYVKNPKPYGVAGFNSSGEITSIEEKPENPKSNYIIPGLYFYDNRVVAYAKELKPSHRGEIEITDINRIYLENKKLSLEKLGRGLAWFDSGTSLGLLEASNFVDSIQNSQGFYIACLEEIAYNLLYIDKEQFQKLGLLQKQSEYGKYILDLVEQPYYSLF